MPNSKKMGKRRAVMMAEDPHCAYCGIEVVYFENDGQTPLPDDFATIEHVQSRNGREGENLSLYRETILACKKCNEGKGMEDQRVYQSRRPYMTLSYLAHHGRVHISSPLAELISPEVIEQLKKVA